jgi:hypothetical protein
MKSRMGLETRSHRNGSLPEFAELIELTNLILTSNHLHKSQVGKPKKVVFGA